MPNNLTTIIQSNLAKVNNNTQLTESQKKTFRELDYQLMFKMLVSDNFLFINLIFITMLVVETG